jgi:hypothetical protein
MSYSQGVHKTSAVTVSPLLTTVGYGRFFLPTTAVTVDLRFFPSLHMKRCRPPLSDSACAWQTELTFNPIISDIKKF